MEFNLIERYFAPLGAGLPAGDLGIGDDGALISIAPDHQLVVVTDTLVCGVHFPEETAAADIAWKALAVNLSDLAAMGATPLGFSLAVSLPPNLAQNEAWMSAFSQGFADLIAKLGLPIPLVGGDTTRSSLLTLTVSAKGLVRSGQALLRSSAQIGDLIVVTEQLGDAALGLLLALNRLPEDERSLLTEMQQKDAILALNRPWPQVGFAQSLFPLVRSAIDVSDGLLQDLGHLLKASSKMSGQSFGARIELEAVPCSRALRLLCDKQPDYWRLPLSGGDDYQLCLSVAPERWPQLQQLARRMGVSLSQIGQITDSGVTEVLWFGKPFSVENYHGYDHF
ncbi:MAG: thiamine-phosphate kinase [Thiotrichales bacterium]|nr:thiamine-phosphate kinase [Thiotrichales bacterium]